MLATREAYNFSNLEIVQIEQKPELHKNDSSELSI